jgi:hypothetical protein
MIYTIQLEDGFYVVKYFNNEISRKKTLLQATKALAAFQKGRN